MIDVVSCWLILVGESGHIVYNIGSIMDSIMDMNRRDFIRFVSVFAVSFLMPCSSKAKEIGRVLDNEGREGMNVRFIKPIKPVNPVKWVLKVDGLCEKPGQFTLEAIKTLPKVIQVSRMTCVEGWSGKANGRPSPLVSHTGKGFFNSLIAIES
jgi:hypothetical protein